MESTTGEVSLEESHSKLTLEKLDVVSNHNDPDLGALSILPGEIRDEIYAYMFTNREATILRTNKAVKEDALRCFQKVAALCIGARCHGSIYDSVVITPSNVSNLVFSHIPNVDLHVDFNRFTFKSKWTLDSEDPTIFVSFKAAMAHLMPLVQRTGQTVLSLTLENFGTLDVLQKSDPESIDMNVSTAGSARLVLEQLSPLVEFEEVRVTAIAGSTGNPFESLHGSRPGSCSDPYRLISRARNLSMYKLVKEILEPSLGPWKRYNGGSLREMYLEFRPRKYWTSKTVGHDFD